MLKQEADGDGARSQGASVDHIPGREDSGAMASGDASTACSGRAEGGSGGGEWRLGEAFSH